MTVRHEPSSGTSPSHLLLSVHRRMRSRHGSAPGDGPLALGPILRFMTDPTLALLVRNLDRAYAGPSWHGPSLATALKGVGREAASFRPAPGRNTVWELVAHSAYWKYRVYRYLTNQPPRSFELSGSNFFPRPEPGRDSNDAWAEDLALLDTWHERLVTAAKTFDPTRLQDHPGKSEHTFEALLAGGAAHDLYHAGQVRLLVRMWESGTESD